jgi:hypothetical protein
MTKSKIGSGDENLCGLGDPYYAFAFAVGLTSEPDPKQWRASHPDQRERIKLLALRMCYGMNRIDPALVG